MTKQVLVADGSRFSAKTLAPHLTEMVEQVGRANIPYAPNLTRKASLNQARSFVAIKGLKISTVGGQPVLRAVIKRKDEGDRSLVNVEKRDGKFCIQVHNAEEGVNYLVWLQ